MGIISEIFKKFQTWLADDMGDSQYQAGDINYEVIAKNTKKVLERRKQIIRTKTLVPVYYTIYLNQKNYKEIQEFLDVYRSELRDELKGESIKYDPNVEEIEVEFCIDPKAPYGHLRIEAYFTRKTAGRSSSNQEDKDATMLDESPIQSISNVQKDSKTKKDKNIPRTSSEKFLYTLEISDGKKVKKYNITKETITIGRSNKMDIPLESPDQLISREHAKITYNEGKIYLTPIGKNPIRMNNTDLSKNQAVLLKHKDVFQVEQYSFKVLYPKKS